MTEGYVLRRRRLNAEAKIRREELDKEIAELTTELGIDIPVTRGDCKNGIRPCPWVRCRYHIFSADYNHQIDSAELEHWVDIDEMPETCSLDVADRVAIDGDEIEVTKIAELMNVSSQNAYYLISSGAEKLARKASVIEAAKSTGVTDKTIEAARSQRKQSRELRNLRELRFKHKLREKKEEAEGEK